MKTLVAVCLLCFIYAEAIPPIRILKDVYGDFMIKHKRVHKDEVEKEMRFGLFLQSMQKIEELNKRKDGATYGITKFADWTAEEKARILTKPHSLRQSIRKMPLARVAKAALPDSFDWRSKNVITPVKNQGQCGSCYAFSSMALVESLFAIKTGQMVDLSEQQLVDCTPGGLGCDGADPADALRYLKTRGALLESQDPYKEAEGSCPSKSGQIFLKTVSQLGSAEDMANYVYTTSPFVMTFTCPDSIYYYVDGVYNPSTSECYYCNDGHAVLAVGFGVENGMKYWLIKNSWDTDFGLDGYFKFFRGGNVCDNEDYNFGATLA